MDRSLEPTERRALAELCAHLPAVRERAEAGSWSDDLDWWVGKVRDGGSAVEACRRLDLLGGETDTDGHEHRSRIAGPPNSTGGRLAGFPEVVLTGRYRCPSGRCARRGQRDDLGRPPVCEVSGVAMLFHADP